MGGLPPLRQNCCILNYRMKSKTPESTVPSSSNSSTCDGATHNPSASSAATKPSTSEPLSLPLKKRKLLVDSDRPRKSPREHASTLAILSLLHQQQQHNRRRTISGSSASGVPLVTTANLPPPSPVTVTGYSPKKMAIQQQQQEADSALGDEIRSSCGSDPITEKDEPMTAAAAATTSNGAKKIKFDPPIMPEGSFVDYKSMCQQLDDFLRTDDDDADEQLELPTKTTTLDAPEPLKQNLLQIVQACDKEPPLSLKLVSRHESIVRKIVQYDRKPRPLSAISIKSFDGGGGGGPGGTTTPGSGGGGGFSLGIFKKRINRTGWPNVKKRIVTRKQQQQQQQQKGGNKRDSSEGGTAAVKKEEPEPAVEDGSRKSSTEESQVSVDTTVVVEESEVVKQEVVIGDQEEEEEDDDDEDEFEDTMTMLDPEEEPVARTATNGRRKTGEREPLLTDDEEDDGEEREELSKKVAAKKETEDPRQTPEPTKTEEILIPSRPCPRSALPSSKYVTKTTTTMTRIDYNVPSSATGTPSNVAAADGVGAGTGKSSADNVAEECDSISSRSIFVSDDCDTTSSTLINMCPEADPLALPCTPPVDVAPPDDAPDADSRSSTPVVQQPRGRSNNTRRHVGPGRKRGNLQPIVCLQKINCSGPATTASTTASCIRTRSSSRTPVKKTYKRSVFTSALVNSAGKPLKKKRKWKKLKLLNGGGASSPPDHGSSSPCCSDDQNSSTAASSSLDAEDPNEDDGRGTDSPTTTPRRSTNKSRPATPSPVKFSPRKLRKPRGRWYRER